MTVDGVFHPRRGGLYKLGRGFYFKTDTKKTWLMADLNRGQVIMFLGDVTDRYGEEQNFCWLLPDGGIGWMEPEDTQLLYNWLEGVRR